MDNEVELATANLLGVLQTTVSSTGNVSSQLIAEARKILRQVSNGFVDQRGAPINASLFAVPAQREVVGQNSMSSMFSDTHYQPLTPAFNEFGNGENKLKLVLCFHIW